MHIPIEYNPNEVCLTTAEKAAIEGYNAVGFSGTLAEWPSLYNALCKLHYYPQLSNNIFDVRELIEGSRYNR